MKVKLKDIAEATGYSVNTVSHALRDMPDISESTKKQILKVAKEMDYIPDLRASSIKSGKSNVISIILPDITNPHFTIVFREMEEYFRKLGITPFFMNTNENLEDELNAVRTSIGQNVDGVIICPTQISREPLELLERSKIPFVLIGRRYENTNYVVCDGLQGAYMATKHLLELNHRKIAYVKTDDRISSDRERFDGYKKALREAGVDFDPALVLQLPLTGIDHASMIRPFLEDNRDCTAVLAFSDILAYAIVLELQKLGLRVPQDVSVMGFDNICSDYSLPVALSSVSVSKKMMANQAAERLYTMICYGDDRKPVETVLPTQLFLRNTVTKMEKTPCR